VAPDLQEERVGQGEPEEQAGRGTLVQLGLRVDRQAQRVRQVPQVRRDLEVAQVAQEGQVVRAPQVQLVDRPDLQERRGQRAELEEQDHLVQLVVQAQLVAQVARALLVVEGVGSQLGRRSSRQLVEIKPSRWRPLQPQTETP
jgi:hypothetical protein